MERERCRQTERAMYGRERFWETDVGRPICRKKERERCGDKEREIKERGGCRG